MKKIEDLIKELCPDGVKYYELAELGNFYGGLTGKSKDDFVNGNAKFITYKNVYSNPALELEIEDKVKISETENQRTLQYGDVIFTGSSETPDECGLSSVITKQTNEKLYLNSFCFFYRFNDKSIMLPDFAKHLFRSGEIRKQIGKTASGVTRYNVSKKLMEKVKIPVPPLEVQGEIAHILDEFTLFSTELSAVLSAELSARKKQFNYYFNKLLNNDEYPKIKLGEIGQVRMCKRIMKAQTNTEKGIPFYKIGTFGKNPDAYISEETFNEYKSKYSYPKKGDILISCSGTIGRTVVFDGNPAYFQDSNIVWLEHNNEIVLNEYLLYCYMTNPWQISTGGTIARLYNENVLKTEIPVPSIDEQRRIVKILDNFYKINNDIFDGLPDEIEKRKKQYEYYRDKLLTFKEAE